MAPAPSVPSFPLPEGESSCATAAPSTRGPGVDLGQTWLPAQPAPSQSGAQTSQGGWCVTQTQYSQEHSTIPHRDQVARGSPQGSASLQV